MNTKKLIFQLGAVFALTTLGACGGGSTSDAPTGSGQSSGANNTQPGNPDAAPATFVQQLVTLVNDARAQARVCGSISMPAAAPVAWNSLLEAAALGHSTYLKDTETFSHTGSGGSTAGQRATAEGYDWQTIGENIAAGYPTPEAVMQGWIDSAGHCENLMAGAFTEMGVSKVEGDASNTYSDYWTMVLAAPR